MKYISMIIYSILLLPFLAYEIKPKFCIDCKFYRNSIFSSSEFGKCKMFPKEVYNDYFLVNGKKSDNLDDYNYCSVARKFDNMCGKEGKFYEPY